ncbi:hypothetical protein CEXT_366851 [Caerostris extrusa]|uniref:Uncharacterized protein n=1 Tax=Caerostris extrusa TaxID=172846 RepID=A0AAV4W8C3_CAEEX|nr:hypothetical protein CEXT_366851 [Caerostris extrusa]
MPMEERSDILLPRRCQMCIQVLVSSVFFSRDYISSYFHSLTCIMRLWSALLNGRRRGKRWPGEVFKESLQHSEIFKDSLIPQRRVLPKVQCLYSSHREINDKMTVAALDGVKVDRDNSIERLIDRCPFNL